MVSELLKRTEFQNKPPVLLDIGASYDLPELWKQISSSSICLAFDGDNRDFNYIEEKRKQFKKLIVVNKIVYATEGEVDFYLTKSPYCSSTLKPDTENLSNYEFAGLFEIDKILKVQSTTLKSILSENNIDYIDWFKTDTQGTDLRIIECLQKSFLEKVIIYELEPGIINAYENEDMLYAVLKFFNQMKFIVVDANIKGSCRINVEFAKQKLSNHLLQNICKLLPATPDWCEITFFNPFTNNLLDIREYILGWIFATIKKQHGLALEIANKGHHLFRDNDFNKMMDYTINEIKKSFEKNITQTGTKEIKKKLKSFFQIR